MPWGKLIDRLTSNTFQISEGLPTAGLVYTEAKFGKSKNSNGVQGSRSTESTRFPRHQCGPGSIPTLAPYVS